LTGYTGSGGVVSIPNFVTSVGSNAFKNSLDITSVSIPNSVTSIGDFAFFDCANLSNLTLPDSVVTIGGFAFHGCTSLTDLTIPDSVASIGPDAFFYCFGLTNVTLGRGLQEVGGLSFYYCSNLASVYFEGDVPDVGSAVFNNSHTIDYFLPGVINSNVPGNPTAFRGNPSDVDLEFWSLPYPLILDHSANFGVQSNAFGFIVSWATNNSVVVEACTNLSNPVWQPILTNTIVTDLIHNSGGSFQFIDPQWTNLSQRFYRVRSL
jgi:hypothetical protein